MKEPELVTKTDPTIDERWKSILEPAFKAPSFLKLRDFLKEEKRNHGVYPPGPEIFRAFDHTPPEKVKVVIIGQDPYHGPGQANGLCFSVRKGVRIPPSLVNIFKELNQDIGMDIPTHGDLTSWADQGVLLLNATLTVRAREAGSHQKKGWEEFTDAVIRYLSEKEEPIVFILWGRFAQQKAEQVGDHHLVLKAAHPSPFSARNGFFGCRHFSKANTFLEEHNKRPINWALK